VEVQNLEEACDPPNGGVPGLVLPDVLELEASMPVAFDLQPEAVLLLLPHLEFLHQAAACGLHFELLPVALLLACC